MLRLFMNFSAGLSAKSFNRVIRSASFYSASIQQNAATYQEIYKSSNDLLTYIRTNTLDTSAKTQVLQASLVLPFSHDSELTREILLIAESFKTSLSNLTLSSYTELLNWALNASEDFSDTRSQILYGLWDGVLELAASQTLEPVQLIELSHQFSQLGMTSGILCEKMTEIDLTTLSVADLNKIIYCSSKTLGKSADKLYSMALEVVNSIPIENYEYNQISELLEFLSYQDRSYSNPYASEILSKLTGYLQDNLDHMQHQDMLHILEFYCKFPKYNPSLLLQIFDKVITDTMNNSTILSVIQYLGRHELKNLKVSNKISAKLNNRLKAMIKKGEMSRVEYLEYVNNSFIHNNIKDLQTYLELQFNKLEKGPWVILALRSMEKLNMTDFHEVLSGDIEEFIKGIDQFTPREKLLAVDNMSMLGNYTTQKEGIQSALDDSILKDIKSPDKLTQYINSLTSLETSRLIDPSILANRLIKSHLLNMLSTYSPSKLVSHQALYIHRVDPNLCITIIGPYLSTLNTSQLLDFIFTFPHCEIIHIMTVFKSLPKVEKTLILESFRFLKPDSNRQHSVEFLNFVNEFSGDVINHPSFRYNYVCLFEYCYNVRGVVIISDFLNRIDQYLYQNVQICNDPFYLEIAACIANLLKLKKETAKEIVKIIMQKDKIEPKYMHIKLAEYSDLESIQEFRKKFMSQLFDLGPQVTFEKLEIILDIVRHLQNRDIYEDELEQIIVNKIENCTGTDMNNLLRFLSSFKAPIYETHSKLVRSLLRAITQSVTKYLPIFEIEEKFHIFNSLARHNSLKLMETYETLLADFQENLHSYTPLQVSKVLESMGRRGILQDDLIIKISDTIKKNPKLYHVYAPIILSTFADLNLEKQKWACETVSILVDSIKSANFKYHSDFLYSNYMWGLVRFRFPLEELERLVIESKDTRSISGFNFKKYLLYNHFRLNPISTQYGDLAQIRLDTKSKSMRSKFQYYLIPYYKMRKALDSMGIEYNKGYCIKDMYVPIHLPNLNKSIWIVDPSQNIYNNPYILRGEFNMYREQLKEFKIDVILENPKNLPGLNQKEEWNKWLTERQLII